MLHRPVDRSPEARLNRVRELVRNDLRTDLATEDKAVLAYARFVMDLQRLRQDEFARFCRMKPTLAELHYLLAVRPHDYLTSVPSECPTAQKDRSILKALILGGEPDQDIADSMDFSLEAVQMFEYLGWDVRARAHRRGWVHNHVLNSPVFTGTNANDYERMFLVTVYRYGIDFFKSLLYGESGESLLESVRKACDTEISSKAFTAGLVTSPNNYNALEILRLSADQRNSANSHKLALDRSGGSGDSGNSAVPKETASLLTAALGGDVGLSVAPFELTSAGKDVDSVEENEIYDPTSFQQSLAKLLEEDELKVAS